MPLLVSTIVPVYNAARYLADALESILGQGYEPLEVIVVDDGSSDGSDQIAARFRDQIQLVHQAHQGPAAARNRGLEMARGEILTFLDADDLWPEGNLDRLTGYLSDHPEAEIVMGRVQHLRLTEQPAGPPRFVEFREPVVGVSLGSAAFRRGAFERIGLLDETMRHSEDVDWFLRAREAGLSIAVLEQVALYYRLHGHNMTQNQKARDFFFAQALKKSLDRRREHSERRASELPSLLQRDHISE